MNIIDIILPWRVAMTTIPINLENLHVVCACAPLVCLAVNELRTTKVLHVSMIVMVGFL